jgi:spermidine synthase
MCSRIGSKKSYTVLGGTENMTKPLTSSDLLNYLLEFDSYDAVIRRFNLLTYDEQCEALGDKVFRGYLKRALRDRGILMVQP